MPNAKRTRKARPRPEPGPPGIGDCMQWFWRQAMPFVKAARRPGRRSTRHLRNAAIEVLEAMRAALDETIEWLKHDATPAELRRIRVEE